MEHLIKSADSVNCKLIFGDENMYSPGGSCHRWFVAAHTRNEDDHRRFHCAFVATQMIYGQWLRLRGLLNRFFTHIYIVNILNSLIYEILFVEYNATLDHISGVFLFHTTLRLIAFSASFFKDCSFTVVYASLIVYFYNTSLLENERERKGAVFCSPSNLFHF